MGHNWKAIADSYFPGRTALQARNQYNLICRRAGLDTQLSTPRSMHDPATPLPMERALPHIKPSHTEFVRPCVQRLPTDTDFDYKKSNNRSGEDDDDDDTTGWPQSEELSQWDLASELSHIQACQSPSLYNAVSSYDLEALTGSLPNAGSLTGPLPNEGMGLFPSFDLTCPGQFEPELGDPQTLLQASYQSFTGDQVWKARRSC